ncbi:hypothetical protein ONS96_003308 [Cadophora gregata f. sp. sojae]|nr:hypothetical protein ONS96_003308 [Cadophora gregata f. sp. sojae]
MTYVFHSKISQATFPGNLCPLQPPWISKPSSTPTHTHTPPTNSLNSNTSNPDFKTPTQENRDYALRALLSWIICTKISLHASPSWSLLSPALVRTAHAVDGNEFDEFRCWAWEKTRVYLSFLSCKEPVRVHESLIDDLGEPAINPGAGERLVSLVRDLLQPFVEMDDGELERCVGIAAVLGFGMQRDLRPWKVGFSQRYSGGKARLDDEGVVRERTLAPFSVLVDDDEAEDFVADGQVTLFPALVALGDESGLRHENPVVIEGVRVGEWKNAVEVKKRRRWL